MTGAHTWTTELPCWTQIRLSNRTDTIRQWHINLSVFFGMCATVLSLLAVEARKRKQRGILAALAMAVHRERSNPGLIFHSDRDVQYAATSFRDWPS